MHFFWLLILIFVFDTCGKSFWGKISESNFEKILTAENR